MPRLSQRRCDRVEAKSGKTLARSFPDVVAAMRDIAPKRFVVDGEIAIPVDDTLSFEALQLRLHPAALRVRKLAAETPAIFVLFDHWGRSLIDEPLYARREALEKFVASLRDGTALRLSPFTRTRRAAENCLRHAGGALDGVIAKDVNGPYMPGERAMLKVKCGRTADCVIGGFRYASNARDVGSLLLSLYNDEGKLDHVGFTATIRNPERQALTKQLEALISPPGFSGNAPGGPSRWSTERTGEWQPLRPELVVEVRYDQVSGNRFRHLTKLGRWRPDKTPWQCIFGQIARPEQRSRLIKRPRARD